jgi:hypothetical protein
MAQIETSLYQTIADNYAGLDDTLGTLVAYAQTALYAIVDVTTSYGDPSGDAAAALQVELALLSPFNLALTGTSNLSGSITTILAAVQAINNYVINNTSGTATVKSKLDTWINTSMPWATCPGGWKDLCGKAGYNTDDWV